jgi:ABC-type Mn2+/Zn2+ transport system permease subunit
VSVVVSVYEWAVEPFVVNPFMLDALLAGLLAVVTTSTVGTWVVLRGLSFLGDALAHGVLPGIAIAFILGVNTTVGALLAALVMVGGINAIRTQSSLPDDTSIGVLFVGFLALAVVIMSSSLGTNTGDLNRFLFGSVTAVDGADLRRQGLAAAISVVGVLVFHRAFMVATFDETLARLLGLRPRLAHAVLLGLLAVSIVASFEVVGNLLVYAFLIAPPATGTLLVRRVPMVMAAAVFVGALAVAVGLLISYHQETAASATMSLVAVTIFVIVTAGRAAQRALVASRSSAVTPSQP